MKVSVVISTYNHERFIDRALASVLDQSTTFDYEVIVSEDRSTDATREIVRRWAREHPRRVRMMLSEHNLRSNEVVARAVRVSAGEYIALLDGDDYWTSRSKLQRQADYLDAHPDYAICFHDIELVDDRGMSIEARRWTPADQKPRSTLEDLWHGNFIATCSVMLRKTALPEIPPMYAEFFPITDWPLYILCAEHGDIGYIPEVMGAYRLHEEGLYSPLSAADKLRATDLFYRRMNELTEHRHDALARRAHRRFFLDWAREYLARTEPDLARLCVRLSLHFGMPRRPHEIVETIRAGLAAYVRRNGSKASRKAEAEP
jgi:glycosyltransferase involved in cell wall biosynthesis